MSWFRPPQPVVRRVDHAQPARCRNCNGASGHPIIPGDYGETCYPCILRLGRVVQSPIDTDPGVLAMLADAHGDVCWTGSCHQHRLCWRWTDDDWPGVGADELEVVVRQRLEAMFGKPS